MSVKAINQSPNTVNNNRQNKTVKKQQTFTGSFNPIVSVMDGIDRGGFIASFLSQDFVGMVAPRIYEGLNRNRPQDEDGKKTGPLNWEFARREGIREILSGPSAYLIPLGILSVIKKVSGTANNVHVNHIEALGADFASYAAKNPTQIANKNEFKKGYYTQVFKNVLSNSTDNNLKNIDKEAQDFAQKLVDVEEKRTAKDKKGAKKLLSEITEKYSKIRKATVSSSSDELSVTLKVNNTDKHLNTNIKRLTQSLTDYTNDALKHVSNTSENIKDTVKKFNIHRAGTRVLTNLGMWGAVVGFYTLIPKLYNMGIKHDPGLKGLEEQIDEKAQNSKEPSFTGLTSVVGEKAMQSGKTSKILKNFEFNGASMSVPAMLTLLFGFTLPPRYLNSKSNKEKKEIVVRDITSFTAILFAAKALSRAFSIGFAKLSGLALNITPDDHKKGILHKLKNFFTAGNGIEVLSSEQIVTKYSNLKGYKDGINGFFDFLQNNGGNVKKVLNIDATVKENSEKIVQSFGKKSLKDATVDEIKEAFKKAKNSDALEKIYTIFSAQDNKFVTRAKTFNSAFGFASTIVLVPAFMMWLARYCEKMTKKAVEKENASKNVQTAAMPIATNKPTMAGFLKN